jgi:thioredoxin 1
MEGNFNTIIQDSRPVLIDFHALWCAPCKVQSPILRDVAAELGDRIRVLKIDVDRNPEIANRYGIRGVPTVTIFKKGEIKYKNAGLHNKSQLIQLLNKNI